MKYETFDEGSPISIRYGGTLLEMHELAEQRYIACQYIFPENRGSIAIGFQGCVCGNGSIGREASQP